MADSADTCCRLCGRVVFAGASVRQRLCEIRALPDSERGNCCLCCLSVFARGRGARRFAHAGAARRGAGMPRGLAQFCGSGPVWIVKRRRRLRGKQPAGLFVRGWGPRVVAGYVEATLAGGVRMRPRGGGRLPMTAARVEFLAAIFATEAAARAA